MAGALLDHILSDVYTSTDSPACYAGADAVYREAIRRNPAITRDQVRDWLARQRTYTLYRPAIKRFPRLKTVPTGLNTDWQADLNTMIRLKHRNDDYNYFLVCVDVLSRMMYVEPVKLKRPNFMQQAFDAIFERAGTKPWKIYTDSGTEFESGPMKRYFERKNIIKLHSNPENDLHATVAERANRTIKERLYRYFSENGTLRWVDAIQDIVDAINNSECRVTGVKPVDVNEANAPDLQERLYGQQYRRKKARFKVDDYVRVQEKTVLFSKGLNKYTDKIFRIESVIYDQGKPLYRLVDGLGYELPGRFYERELVKTVSPEQTTTRIARVLRRRVHRERGRQVLVRWVGHEPEHDEWIDDPNDDIAAALLPPAAPRHGQ